MPSISTSQKSTVSQLNDEAISRALAAVNVADLAVSCVNGLRSVLRALCNLSTHDEVFHDLAEVGYDIANDRHNLLDCQRADIEQKFLPLKGANHD